MKEKELNGLELKVYEKVIYNLPVYVVPVNNVNSIYSTLSVKFGGDNEEFLDGKTNKKIKMCRGIAHYMEHQNFNEKDGSDVFSFYSERGSSCNASTRNNKTTYLFSGVNFFEDNLNKLLDFVFNPYFTDDSVKKELGIIEEEIKMYDDDPYVRMSYQMYENLLNTHPMKTPLIGTSETISKITKEDLYTCYDYFYRPDNMFLVVTGNVDPQNVFKIVDQNMKKKKFKNKKAVKLSIIEKDEVAKKEQVFKFDFSVPKVIIAYKININNLKNIKRHEVILYLNFLFESKLGVTSKFLEELKNSNLIIDNFYLNSIDIDTHILIIVQAESFSPKELIKKVKDNLKNLDITLEELERRKKVLLSYQILASENIYQINNKIVNNLINYNCILYDSLNDIKNLNYKQFKYVINNIDLNNNTVLYTKK